MLLRSEGLESNDTYLPDILDLFEIKSRVELNTRVSVSIHFVIKFLATYVESYFRVFIQLMDLIAPFHEIRKRKGSSET